MLVAVVALPTDVPLALAHVAVVPLHVKTWALAVPAAINAVDPLPFWIGICPAAPFCKLVAVVTLAVTVPKPIISLA